MNMMKAELHKEHIGLGSGDNYDFLFEYWIFEFVFEFYKVIYFV